MKFADLIAIPRKQRSTKVRQKTFTTHLLSSDENLAKICNADKQAKKTKKTEIQRKRENALKIPIGYTVCSSHLNWLWKQPEERRRSTSGEPPQ